METTNTVTKPRLMKFAAHLPEIGASMRRYKNSVTSNNTEARVMPNKSMPANTIIHAHKTYLQNQTKLYQQFLKNYFDLAEKIVGKKETPPSLKSAPQISAPQPRMLPGPKFSRHDLEFLASDKISTLFGALFEKQDQYAIQVRMPEPPLLLADRITGIDAKPGVLGKGTLWSETDITENAWYLHQERMSLGIMIESGQADLLLISWMGIDFYNQGERAYRLLGCDLTLHGEAPKIGDTLCYEIHVDGHAKSGDVRLFFFHYDCHINGKLRLSVRNCQAGFFTKQELAESEGVIWDVQTADYDQQARVDSPAVVSHHTSFSCEQVHAFSHGRVYDCFGPGFELTLTHTRTPRIHNGDMLLLGEITEFDVQGGPWKRGYMRGVRKISPDDWFFKGHFKNDPCMPGTLMVDAGVQLTAFYMTACGLTLDKDGWRFEVIQGEEYKMRCRGQVTPTSQCIEYEIFVESLIIDKQPKIHVHLLGRVDGLNAFQTRLGVQLVPDWPLSDYDPQIRDYIEATPVAQQDGFEFGYKSLLSAALGKPSNIFGDEFKMFDSHRRAARLPGPPYHFMSRILRVDTRVAEIKTNVAMECEYDVPADAWYFNKNQAQVMPFAVLLEIALQPCGWFACFMGFPKLVEEDLLFRNLDGNGALTKEIKPNSGALRIHVTFKSYSRIEKMILVSYHVTCFSGDEKFYEIDTGFGFFPRSAFENQVGLPLLDYEKGLLEKPNDYCVDLTKKPDKFFTSTLRLADDMLLMIDRVTGFWPKGGSEGKGLLRAEKDVKPDEWFFKAHFFQDPVQPGSLGLEAMLQLLQFYMIEANLGKGIENPRFEPLMLDKELTWKYRGQVVPSNKVISTVVNIIETGRDERGVYAIAEASLWVDGKRIYEAKNMGLRIVDSDMPAESFIG